MCVKKYALSSMCCYLHTHALRIYHPQRPWSTLRRSVDTVAQNSSETSHRIQISQSLCEACVVMLVYVSSGWRLTNLIGSRHPRRSAVHPPASPRWLLR